LPRRLVPYLIGLFVLGGLQGLLGWAMVASGLVDRPSVSHYRLAAHLSMDLTIYSLTLWTAFFVARPRATLLTPGGDQPILQRHADPWAGGAGDHHGLGRLHRRAARRAGL
jgi:cytochrome c oxidase assembly protein subunit 15